jgi:hypothetical protein
VVGLVVNLANEFRSEPKANKRRMLVMPELMEGLMWGFYDGTSYGHPPRCGVGVVLHITKDHFFIVRYTPGYGSNMKA